MEYTRAGEGAASDVISAHNAIIWEFNDGAIAASPTATIQFVVKDNAGATLYTSSVFACYLLSYSAPTANFRFDASQIIKHIINNYFYREMTSDVISAENYGSELEVTIKSYDNAVLEDTEALDYFACHAVNQIGDEYGANIPRVFYNDTEDIAHFLGYPNHLFFYMSTDQSAHSPLIEIISNDITESENLINTLTNQLYDTFTVAGTSLTSVIELSSVGQGHSSTFAVVKGESFLILVPAFVLNSGELPHFYLWDFAGAGGAISRKVDVAVGDNAFVLTSTITTTAELRIRNETLCNWECGPIQIIPVESASGNGTLGLFVHSVDLGIFTLSAKSKYVRIYYDYDALIKIKDYNLTIFQPCPNAVYIRWLNSNGDYSYFAFSPYPINSVEGSAIGKVINSFNDQALANSRSYPVGYRDSFKKMDVIASAVPIVFRRKLVELFTSPAVYIWQGEATPDENLILTLENLGYNTLISDGTVIISAISIGATGNVLSVEKFDVNQGDTITVIFDLTLNSGQLPVISLLRTSDFALVSNSVNAAAGYNTISLVATTTTTVKLIFTNSAAANFSTSKIIVKRAELETDWILLEGVEGSHQLRTKKDADNFACTLVLPENFTQQLGGVDL